MIKTFFYAGDDAIHYDEIARLTDRSYELVHDMLLELFLEWRAYTMSSLGFHSPMRVANIGCGTGAEAIRLLAKIDDIELVCIDISDDMIAVLESKLVRMFGDKTAGGRCSTYVADVREAGWLKQAVASAWGDHREGNLLTAAVSAHTFHHFSPQQKLLIYKEIYEQLMSHGVFANIDLFSFETPWLAKFVQMQEEKWLEHQFSNPNADVFKRSKSLRKKRERMTREWLRHLQEDNRPLPIHKCKPVVAGLNALSTECDVLSAAGFSSVECVFRYYQTSIVWTGKT